MVGEKKVCEVDGTEPPAWGEGSAATSPGSCPPPCTTNLHLLLLQLQCFMLPSHTALPPSLPIVAPLLLANFSNWHKVPLNTSGKQNTQECCPLLTPNFGSLQFRDRNRYLEKYFSVEEFLDSGLCWVNCAVLKCCCISKHFSLHFKSFQY